MSREFQFYNSDQNRSQPDPIKIGAIAIIILILAVILIVIITIFIPTTTKNTISIVGSTWCQLQIGPKSNPYRAQSRSNPDRAQSNPYRANPIQIEPDRIHTGFKPERVHPRAFGLDPSFAMPRAA